MKTPIEILQTALKAEQAVHARKEEELNDAIALVKARQQSSDDTWSRIRELKKAIETLAEAEQ